MAGRAVVFVCLLANVAAAAFVLCLGIAGFSWHAIAGVYPHEPVQSSQAPWEVATPEADVQRAVRALDRIMEESIMEEPALPEVLPKTKPSPKPVARVAPVLVVPKPGSVKRDSRPRIAVVIDDLGLNATRTRRMISLDGPLTLAFLPYGYNLESYSSDAVSQGHEVFLHLPMEPFGSENPGPNALLEHLAKEEFERRMVWVFDQVNGIKGFNNHMGSRLTANPIAMKRVMAEARRRNLLFLDSRTSGRSVAYSTAMAAGVPAESRDIFLDHDPSAANIARQFAKVEKLARRRGHAIAIGHPYDTTFSVLKGWIKDARERGFELVPVSVLIEASNTPRVAAAGAPAPAGRGGVHTSVQRDAQ